MGGAAALRPGASQRAAHERDRSRYVEWFRVRPGLDPPGDDALRHRRHPPIAGRRSQISGAVLTVKFSCNWIREMVPDLADAPEPLEKLITMKTAECEGIQAVGALLACAVIARVESVTAIPDSHNVIAVIDAGPVGHQGGHQTGR